MGYRANTALGGSDIRAMVQDFDAWLFERELRLKGEWPEFMERTSSPAAEFGTLVHQALLEPTEYRKNIILTEPVSFATKAGKALKAEAEEKGVSIVKQEQAWAIEQIEAHWRKEIYKKELSLPLPKEVEVEKYAQAYGIDCKGKLDWLTFDTLFDLKTIGQFHKRHDVLYANAYHAQLAHYAALCEEAPSQVGIIWIESVAPFRVEVQNLQQEEWDFGKQARELAIKRYAEHLAGEVGL